MSDYLREFNIANGKPIQSDPRKNRNLVEFFEHQIQDETESAAKGRPIFKSLAMIRIMKPGDKNYIYEGKATEAHKIEYARQWDAFQKSTEMAADGTPLEVWSQLDRARVRELKYCNVYTVETLAALSDAQIMDIGMLGLRTLVKMAKAYLETAKTGAVPAQLVEKSERLELEVESLKKQLSDANARFESELRALGRNPAASEASMPPAAPTQSKPVEVVIPDDFAKMGQKEVIALAKQVTGLSARNRAEAEDWLRDAKADGKANA